MALLELDDLDLSSALRLAHDEGLDPAPFGHRDPQFSGIPAFREGERHTGDAVRNAERIFPLILKAETTAALHEQAREIEGRLERGREVAYAVDEADEPTRWDLERGRLEPDYEHFLSRAGRLRCVLRLWTRPYGHSGTYRSVASDAGLAARQVPLAGVEGDVAAQTKLVATFLDQRQIPDVVAYGVHHSPSFVGVLHGASFSPLTTAATIVGDAAAIGSQYLGLAVHPDSFFPTARAAWQVPNSIRDAYPGRYRVMAAIRTRISHPSGAPQVAVVNAIRKGDDIVVAERFSASPSTDWRLLDLGEMTVPSAPSGVDDPLGGKFQLHYEGASGATALASPGLHLGGVVLVPVDYSAGVYYQPNPPPIFGGTPFAGESALAISDEGVFRWRNGPAPPFEGADDAALRGAAPRLAPSQAAQLVLLAGKTRFFNAARESTIEIVARERFTYFR